MSIITTYLHVYPDTLGSAQTKSVGEMPSHNHIRHGWYNTQAGEQTVQRNCASANKIDTDESRYGGDNVGNDKYHNNISPSIAGYAWIRTA